VWVQANLGTTKQWVRGRELVESERLFDKQVDFVDQIVRCIAPHTLEELAPAPFVGILVKPCQ